MSNAATGAGTGAIQGAGAGAAVGMMVGGPVGAGVGAVIGAVVGGVWGGFGGSLGDKAEKKLKQAKQLQRLREQDAYKQKLLSTLRQGRIQRSSALASAVAANAINSSSTEAALSSIGSQIANQVEYMSVDQGRAVKIEQLTNKASKLAKRAETQQQLLSATTGSIFQLATVGGSAKNPQTPSSTQVYDAPIGPTQTVYANPIGPQPLTYTYPIGPSNSMGPYLPPEYQTFTTNNALFR